jgi:outer membrane protein
MRLALVLALVWQQIMPAQTLPGSSATKQTGGAGSAQDPLAKQQPGSALPSGTDQAAGKTEAAPALSKIESNDATPKYEDARPTPRASFFDFAAPYRRPSAEPLKLGAADRARALIKDGVIYLSLYDAIALAVENNLDVEVARYNLSIAGTDVLRASGGGNLRGLDYTVSESPTGVGGPGSPLLNSAASSVTPQTPTINDLTSLNVLTQTPSNLSVQNPAAYSSGPPVPTFQPTFVGQNMWFQRSNATLLTGAAPGTIGLQQPGTLNFLTANYALIQGFSYGTQVEVGLNNAATALYGSNSQYNPFSTPNTSITVSQPLFRGLGRKVNLRYMRIANVNQRISRLLFYQQLISTVYGVARIYYDLVSLNENAAVKQQTLAAARKLFEDDSSQVDQGTLAPLELTRARSLVTSSELDSIQAEGLVRQEEVILKTQLARRGTADPVLTNLRIKPTDPITIPPADALPSLAEMVSDALNLRPDLLQASLQVQSGELAVEGSKNATLPQVDVVANFQTRGSTEAPFINWGTPGTGLITAPPDLSTAGLRTSRLYQAGVQLNLPLKNHVAQADAARDLLQLRQAQSRTQLLANQVREQVENSVIALQTARSALAAATQSREYQEQLLDAEKDKLTVGASTNLLVIQQQTYLAQARSTEVSARSVWIKARVALDRAVGDLLERNGISYADSLNGELPKSGGAQQ